MDKFNFPVVILAGGKSSRMKRDKSLLPFGNYPTLCQYQYQKLEKIFSTVYISAKKNKFDFIKDQNILIKDTEIDYSPMIALKAILKYINSSYIFILPVDIPLIEESTIQKMVETFHKTPTEIIIPKDNLGNTHNLCGIFHISTLPTIESLLAKNIHKINTLIQQSNSKIIEFDNPEQFSNLNTPDEYQKVLNK